LALLALAIIAFLGQAGPLGWAEHARSQRVAYADLRRDLSAGTVPTGQQIDKDGDGVGDAFVAVGTPLGFLSSPELGLTREVILEGTTSTVTEKGPGHLRTSALPGQPGIVTLYGRSWGYGGPFRHVPELREGAVLTFATGQGTSTYRVRGTRHAGDTFVAPQVGKGVLTLVTSEGHAFVPTRAVYVDAELTSTPFAAPTPVLGAANLSTAEGPLSGDASVWPVLFMMMQALALVSLALAWASRRFGGAQAWLVGVPVIGLLLVLGSREALRLLPNLL
ncbi:MAG: class E sortase, partial [Actinomycetota bacterium]|nr:class E sortase [Actinomycetota bacterium]